MEEKDIAIQIEGLRKRYRLGTIGGSTLRGDIESWWAKKRGKEDPNSKIGSKVYAKNELFYALDGIDLTVYKGERLGIIGHNGAGKSTLLKLLSRVTAPTEGRISIDGRIASMLEVGMGFNGELTGRENIYLNGAILGMSKSEVDAKMERIIDFSEVRQFIDTPVKRYSSGMFVKLAFSVAAHLDSEIMIMDEVLAVGDMTFQKKCLNKMSEVSKSEGRTVLYVSHNMNTIRQLCNRCVVLDHGKLIYDGDVEEAIRIYMGTNTQDEYATFYDFSEIERTHHFGKLLKIQSMELLDKETSVYEIGEPLRFRLTIDSTIEFDDACMLLHIRNDAYEKIGMSCSELFSIKKGKHTKQFSFNTGFFTEDVFCINIEIVELDKEKDFSSYDNPSAIIHIKMLGKTAHAIRWNKTYWGNIAFPITKVED